MAADISISVGAQGAGSTAAQEKNGGTKFVSTKIQLRSINI